MSTGALILTGAAGWVLGSIALALLIGWCIGRLRRPPS